MSEEIVYVVIMHSFKDPFIYYYPEVFRNEKDAVRYAYDKLLKDSGFEYRHDKNDEDSDDEDDGNENEYDLSKFVEKDRNLPRKEIASKYEPNTVHEFDGSVYMLRKLGFKFIHECPTNMENDGDYACQVFRQKIR